MKNGKVKVYSTFFHAGPAMRFHSAIIVTAPKANRLNVMPRTVSIRIRPSMRITRYVMYAGCAKLVTHRSTASSSEPMVTRLHGATVISIS